MQKSIKYEFNSSKYDIKCDLNRLNYIICSTPRSGSTFLAKSLQETKIAGLPHEYFNIEHKNDYFNRWHFCSIQEYISLLITNRSTNNGIFGLKLHYNQYISYFENEILDEYFSDLKYIFITRRNKVLQGISLEKAFQTGQWTSEFSKIDYFKFNYNSINGRIEELINEENQWLKYFELYKISPLIINYEDFELNFEKTIRMIMSYLDVESPNEIKLPSIRKQRKLGSYFWEYLFRLLKLIRL